MPVTSSSYSILDIESVLRSISPDFYTVGSGAMLNLIENMAAIDDANSRDITFCSDLHSVSSISKSNAGIILCNKKLGGKVKPKENQLLIFLSNPKLAFIHIAKNLFEIRDEFNQPNTLSKISRTAKIDHNCIIGDFSIVGDNCTIGENTVVLDRAILKNCVIGKNCLIQSGVTLGEAGFGYERDTSLELVGFPHFGQVILGSNVEIKANCSIARGSLKDTIIGDGTKIDGLVHIAHNTIVGKNCQITAGSIIGGSVTVGDNSWLGLNSTLKHKIKVGQRVIVGSGASVIHDISDEDIVAGVPVKSIKQKVTSEQLFLMAGQTRFSTRQTKVDSGLHY